MEKEMKQGIYTMTYAEYDKAPGIRQSNLKAMARSAAHFKAAMEEPDEETRALIIGRIFHTAVLEPNLLAASHYIRPETYENAKGEIKRWNGNAGECKDWSAAHEDRPVLFNHELEDIIGMRKSVMENPDANAALTQGESEVCLFWQDPKTEIGLKCRCDRLSGNSVVDLKSTEDASEEGFAKSIAKFGYDVQAAYNLDGAKALGLEKKYFIVVPVEKAKPYGCAVYQLDEASVDLGRSKYHRWLSLLAHCYEYNEWPGYPTGIKKINVSDWEFQKWDRQLER